MDWKKAKHLKHNNYNIPINWMHIHYFEAYNILFRLENTLRLLVYIVLKSEFENNWLHEKVVKDRNNNFQSINSVVKFKIKNVEDFEYIGYNIKNPIMYLSLGELVNIIKGSKISDIFASFFLGDIKNVTLKLDEIKNIRNELAHFRPIREEDVGIIKSISEQVFKKIQNYISNLTISQEHIPSNLSAKWYTSLCSINKYCDHISFSKSRNEDWIKIFIMLRVPVIINHSQEKYLSVNTLIPKTKMLLSELSKLQKITVRVSDNMDKHIVIHENRDYAIKRILFIVNAKKLKKRYVSISAELKKVLMKIDTENREILKNPDSRGTIVDSIHSFYEYTKAEHILKTDNDEIHTRYDLDDPLEMWGKNSVLFSDFITDTDWFPWMKINIGESTNNDEYF